MNKKGIELLYWNKMSGKIEFDIDQHKVGWGFLQLDPPFYSHFVKKCLH